MKIAVLSDIHANSWALESVIEDIRHRNVNDIYDLGDSLYGPLDPEGTFELLMDNKIISLAGNEDRLIIEDRKGKVVSKTLEFVLRDLQPDAIKWLKELPKSRKIENEIYFCHGTPDNDTEYLIEHLVPGRVVIKDLLTLDKMLTGIEEKFVFCGHSHCQRIVETGNKTIINPGSVGCPAYDDDLPIPHKMENYSPMARYCIMEITHIIKIEQIAISYDFEIAAWHAEKNNRRDWAEWLRTGWVK